MDKNDSAEDLKAFLEEHRKSVAWSVVSCGQDSHVLFERTYVGFAYTIMKPGEIGTSLTCAPYVSLARNAVPSQGFNSLNKISLKEWLKDRDLTSLVEKINKK